MGSAPSRFNKKVITKRESIRSDSSGRTVACTRPSRTGIHHECLIAGRKPIVAVDDLAFAAAARRTAGGAGPPHGGAAGAPVAGGEALLRADPGDAVLREALALVAEADAIVVGTPVYKASFSGVLKVFLDLLPQDGLAGKLVLPVATGGSQSHMLALDYALRPVLASLAPRHILPSIYAASSQLPWLPEAGLQPAKPIAARIEAGIEQLHAELQQAQLRKAADIARPPAIAA
jgi:FMN reductase